MERRGSAWRSSVIAELPSPSYDDFLRQIAKADVEEIVAPVRSLTALAADGYTGEPVALLYIDGDHHKEAALADFRAWRRHLTDDAVIIFDDYGVTKNIGVTEAVTILRKSGEFLDPEQQAGGRLAVGKPGSVIGARFRGSRNERPCVHPAGYWDRRYRDGRTSGAGSEGAEGLQSGLHLRVHRQAQGGHGG